MVMPHPRGSEGAAPDRRPGGGVGEARRGLRACLAGGLPEAPHPPQVGKSVAGRGLPSRPGEGGWPSGGEDLVLLGAQPVDQPAGGDFHVVIGQHRVLRHIALELAADGDADRQQALGA